MSSAAKNPKISGPGVVHSIGRFVGTHLRGTPGVDRFLRGLHDPDGRRESWMETVSSPWHGGPRFHISTRWFTEWTTWFYGTQDVEIYEWVIKHARSEWVALDIGMNFGFFACLLAQRCSAVYGFEPVPWLAKRAQANGELNGFNNLTITEMALSDRTGKVMLHIPSENDANWGTSSLTRESGEGAAPIEVPTDTLDNFAGRAGFKRVDFIKLDVEGAEFMVLKGGAQTLAKFKPVIIFERNAESAGPIMDLLSRLGYEFFDLKENPLEAARKSLPSDILAVARGPALP